MKDKSNILFIIFFGFITGTLFFALVDAKVFFKRNYEKKVLQARETSTIEIDWEKKYPFSDVIPEKKLEVEDKEVSGFEKITSQISKLGRIGNEWVSNSVFYDDVAKAGYVLNSFLKDPAIGTSYVETRNGYLVMPQKNTITFDDAKAKVVPYYSLQEYVENQGKDFLYFYVPNKVCKINPNLSEGVTCKNNEEIDIYLSAMEQYGINYVDIRECIHDDGIDHYSLYYKTDHHWTPVAGLWAASVMSKKINEKCGYSMIEANSIGTYENVIYADAEFGSQGETVGRFVASPEDFIVPKPKFQTNFHLEVPSKGIYENGSFMDLFVDEDGIHEVVHEGGGAAYAKILCGNPPYISIRNNLNPSGPKVVMIRDSYASVVAPYFAFSCSELILIDTRISNGNFTGSIVNCINQVKPDIVVCLQCEPQEIKLNK